MMHGTYIVKFKGVTPDRQGLRMRLKFKLNRFNVMKNLIWALIYLGIMVKHLDLSPRKRISSLQHQNILFQNI
jgi:hypothetical protein